MRAPRFLGPHICGCGRDFASAEAILSHWKDKNNRAPCAAPICGYCGNGASFARSSDHLYASGRDYGPVWACKPCGAWVGCHPGTAVPLGVLANKALRQAKSAVHRDFDPIWQRGYVSRRKAYALLAAELGIPVSECHVGNFDLGLCERAIAACRIIGPRLRAEWLAAKTAKADAV